MKRLILGLFVLCSFSPMFVQDSVTAGELWPTSTPEAQGIRSAVLADTLAELHDRDVGLHSFLVIRNGHNILDVSVYPFENDQPHVQFSATKSVLSILVGIAIDRGELEGVDQPVFAFFDDVEYENDSEAKHEVTIEHLLTMRSGLVSTLWLNSYDDWLQHALDAPVNEPGTQFYYTDANAHLVAALLERVTGMPLHEYADEVLFQPLGITSAQWELAPEGVQSGDGLYLAPYDMARIGYLYLNEGEWNGQRIVSADWVERSTQPDVNEDYGYMWWIFDGYFLAAGHRGQLILVAPELDMVIVTTSEFDIFPIIGPMEEFLFPFVQTNEQLPENPSEAERLATEVQQFTAPQAEELAAVPDTQNLVDGQRYVFEPNDLNWDAMTLTFSETEAIFTLETATTVETFNVGLDGIARINLTNNPQRFLSNTPVAMNGEWTRETTFIIDARYLDGRDFWTYSMRFGDNVRINARENILSGIIDSRFVIEGNTQD